mmetsp:Transcript_26753/g.50961  ORF Transcript_26753/g.50961 Transcript_26753/m.50961 type:complete len:321 (-) Transcript_26753:669-1631(-)|eukprot:CAMPEP_0114227592 /NCGR_PEP_ID=MMETSP0058-20121206/1873_1 /TAXON_ID=36894 /ORGANISM="Pyramimonas parkeae, CCMP726" /LENGTH=320 /DNA_ID=CAMNT_0001338445 /DNA_START=15 /DNA_END=977 /DNA_ORIENTATION=+
MTSIWSSFLEYERSFSGQQWIEFTKDHAEIPILAVAAYLFIVFYVPDVLKSREPFNLKGAFALWNLFLAIFSTLGVTRTLPHLVSTLSARGFKYTVCEDPTIWYNNGACGLWVGLFIYSKIPELLDTVFLVLQKKRVIFLAWFHHTTVLLYCWHAYHNRIAPGLWFASANYMVHSVMYTYYFLNAAGLYYIARPCAPFITTVQILQMVMGSTVTTASAIWHAEDPSQCAVDPANYKLGLVMYVSYFWLFSVLFVGKYFGSKSSSVTKQAPASAVEKEPIQDTYQNIDESLQMCGVDLGTHDTAGFFHSTPRRSERLRKVD